MDLALLYWLLFFYFIFVAVRVCVRVFVRSFARTCSMMGVRMCESARAHFTSSSCAHDIREDFCKDAHTTLMPQRTAPDVTRTIVIRARKTRFNISPAYSCCVSSFERARFASDWLRWRFYARTHACITLFCLSHANETRDKGNG